MNEVEIKINILDHGAKELPKYETSGSSGMDLKAAINNPIILKKNERKIIPTGIKVEIPKGYEIQIRPRSGLAIKYGITILNSPGTIDSDYRGEIGIITINHGNEDFKIMPNDRIAQMVIAKIIYAKISKVDKLSDTKRGSKGYGSTGKNNE
tara:strand:- start:16275 stop:16730 length:456 start_codon:yes stop_codon:yes gene_type:complete